MLDEADRLLGGRFDQQIATIFNALPKERQTLLFSATMTDTLEKVRKITNKNVSYKIESDCSFALTFIYTV